MKSPSKIGMLHYTAPKGEIGGVEVVIDYHTRFLIDQGYKVRLIYGKGGGIGYQGVEESKIDLLSANHPRVLKVQEEILKKYGETPLFRELKEEIKEELGRTLKGLRTCIVHNVPCMNFNFALTAALNELSNEIKTKMIFWAHDSALLRKENSKWFGKFPFTLLHPKNKNIKYITCTTARALELRSLPEPFGIQELTVIPNGVSIEEYIKIDDVTKQLMNKLAVTFDQFIILIPVRITPRKNIELALYVASELKHLIREVNLRLIITGPPDHQAVKMGMKYVELLEHVIKTCNLGENVIFCHKYISRRREYEDGHISKWSVADAYNIADLVFIPSKEEGFGLPILEAGASRKPIFCSRIPPFQELIRDDIEGHMFDLKEDPKSIAFRIYRRYLSDTVENNFNNINDRFNWDYIIKQRLIPIL